MNKYSIPQSIFRGKILFLDLHIQYLSHPLWQVRTSGMHGCSGKILLTVLCQDMHFFVVLPPFTPFSQHRPHFILVMRSDWSLTSLYHKQNPLTPNFRIAHINLISNLCRHTSSRCHPKSMYPFLRHPMLPAWPGLPYVPFSTFSFSFSCCLITNNPTRQMPSNYQTTARC